MDQIHSNYEKKSWAEFLLKACHRKKDLDKENRI
jgi:hypothetical protein